MNLEKIQEEIINKFDFDRAVDILNRLDEKFIKDDLQEIARGLIKMLYQSREMYDMVFSSGYLIATRSYIDNVEVHYSLSLSVNLISEFTYDLEKPFDDITNEKNIIKNELEKLLELNQEEYDKNEDNDLAFNNICKIEKMMILLD